MSTVYLTGMLLVRCIMAADLDAAFSVQKWRFYLKYNVKM